jgi:hypothetical protein
MTKLSRREIQDRARRYLEQASSGIRYMELAKKIHDADPETPFNTIVGSLHDLSLRSEEIVRPSRGLWTLKKYAEKEPNDLSRIDQPKDISSVTVEPRGRRPEDESAYYESFAQWLIGQDQVIEAMVVGGNTFRSKWATPDVIGTYKPKKSDPVPFPIELVSAEIKSDGTQSITAFGQACAYRLFSHKTYIVMPSSIGETDLDRLDALCSLYGMGLILFDLKPEAPNFQMQLKAQRLEPDTFYVNDFARRLLDANRTEFDRLFG